MVILVFLIAAAASLAIWQRNNLKSLQYATMKQEQLDSLQQQEAASQEKIKQEYAVPEIALSTDQEQQLSEGSVSAEEMAEEILSSNAGTTSVTTAEDDSQAEIQRQITRLYVLQSSMLGQIASIADECRTKFYALDQADRTSSNKRKIVMAELERLEGLESSCDAEVNEIVESIRTAGKKDLANQVLESYRNAKSLKKAELMKQFTM